MAKRKHSELAAGVFVILTLGAGIGVLLWLGVAEAFTTRGDRVVFFTSYQTGNLGLEVGSAVKVNDKPIGKVDGIQLDTAGGRTLYTARLNRRDLKIHTDARATAVTEFIGGAAIVLENFGTDAAPPADEQNPLLLLAADRLLMRVQEALGYGEDQREQFQQTIASIAEAAGSVQKIAAALAVEVNAGDSEALLAEIKTAVGSLKVSSANLADMSGSLKAETERKNADSLLAKVHVAADHVDKLAAEASGMITTVRPDVEKIAARVRQYAEKDLADILTRFRTASTDLVNIAADLRSVSATSKDIVVLNRQRLEDTLASLKSMSLNLDAAAKEIRRNPWRLLRRPSEQQLHSENIYDAARAFAEGAGQLEDALTRLAALREARPQGVTADDPELVKIRKHVETTFEKFREVEDALWKELTK
ncbi:MAG: hypothetical protein AMJ81_07885 [Phycisphaerae bacterium SM23_33]|nr:MAG: hypothetical protein AMJ81_07885 [Phycisphaerae bacterium SM23_33]